jgi:putative transposase
MWTDADRKEYAPTRVRYESDLTDEEWEIISVLFEDYCTLTVDLREMVNACFYIQRTGCQWRYLPKEFGSWQTVRWWHDRFKKDGIWEQISALLHSQVRKQSGKNPQPSTTLLDSQSVPSGPQAGERGYDGHKKIKGIKRHALVCTFGFILAVIVTPANVHDTKAVPVLLERANESENATVKNVLVDGIYKGPIVDEAAKDHGVDVQIASKNKDAEKKGFIPQPIRWRIEATFGIMTNYYRRLTRNWEQSPEAHENICWAFNARRLLYNFFRNKNDVT